MASVTSRRPQSSSGGDHHSQYRGHDVPPPAVTGGGELAESPRGPSEIFDNLTGILATEKARDVADEKFTMRWHAISPEDVWRSAHGYAAVTGAGWLSGCLAGRKTQCPPPTSDMQIPLRVFCSEGNNIARAHHVRSGNRNDNHRHYRRITAASAGPTVDGRPTIDPTTSRRIRRAASASQFGRISYLRCVRFDADRIEFCTACAGSP